ncbi:MAG: alpha/beta hydrolase, partial [Bryobacteraceae bacterium]
MRVPIAIALSLFCAAVAPAQRSKYTPLPPFPIPGTVELHKAEIYSEGTRMAADVYVDKANAGGKLPCVVMAQGWGGVAASLRREAVPLAQAGYFVVAFDYRGWGASDSRVILTAKRAPAEKQNYRFTAEVQEVRQVVEPLDMVIDWQNAIAWTAADPRCEASRLGLWGTSLSGGLVVSAAVRDPRVKAVHSQVSALDGRWTL